MVEMLVVMVMIIVVAVHRPVGVHVPVASLRGLGLLGILFGDITATAFAHGSS